MKENEAKLQITTLLNSVGIAVSGLNLTIPENINLPKALKIEEQMEDVVFQNEDNIDCVFQIIDDKLVIVEI